MKKAGPIVGGVIGAVLGFIVTFTVLGLIEFGNPADPIMSGLLVLVVFGPAGALAGLVLGTRLGMRMRGGKGGGSLFANSLKALAVVIAIAGAVGASAYGYVTATATPWLNPNGATPLLMFELRLPADSPRPSDMEIELQTDLNRMPGEVFRDQFREDGDRAVVAGAVELAFRTPSRQIEVKIAGEPDRVFPIGLGAKAPHASQFGPWEGLGDGSEIRYRAEWPGQN
jgi:hypothetical protein